MYKNYFKIAVRNLLRHKTFSFINIVGLALSMSVGLLIISMISGLSKYDRFHENYDQIFRILSKSNKESSFNATSPMPLRKTLLEDYEGIEKVVSFKKGFGGDAIYDETAVPLVGYFCSEELFDVFSFRLEKGNANTALKEPYSVVLSSESAKKLFGEKDPIGKIIRFNERGIVLAGIPNKNKPTFLGDYTVTGVLDELPGKTHLEFQILASLSSLESLENRGLEHTLLDDWKNNEVTYNYALIDEGYDELHLLRVLDNIASSRFDENADFSIAFKTQPLAKITPGKLYGNPFSFRMPIQIIYFFAVLAFIVLMSACLNYTNLSLARSLSRAREVGIRKTSGAFRGQIFFQFIAESVIVSFVSLIFAFGLLQFLQPALAGLWVIKYVRVDYASDLQVYGIFLIFSILIGIIAGALPAFNISRFNPIKVLKGRSGDNKIRRLNFRKVLIVAQFAISLFFIITTIAVNYQLKHLVTSDYGFQEDNIINISLQGNDYNLLEKSIGDHSGIIEVSGSSVVLATGGTRRTFLKNSDDISDSTGISYMSANSSFFSNHNLNIVSGKTFPSEFNNENEQYIILNETAVNKLGYDNPHEILGNSYHVNGCERPLLVIGVAENFHYSNLMNKIGPFAIRNNPDQFRYANVRIKPGQEEAVSAYLESQWKAIDRSHTYEASYLSHQLKDAQMIFSDISYILGFISLLAISIASLGLLGMVIFITQGKVKEVGIRKVFGADLKNLIINLSKGFVMMLFIATLIAAPLAKIVNDLWLREFASRISIGFEILGIGIFTMLLLGFLAIFINTVKIAKTNASDVLRYE